MLDNNEVKPIDDDNEDDPIDFSDSLSEDIEEVIEITEDDLEDFKAMDDSILKEEIVEDESASISKHKQSGKHSLKYDTIFKGKKLDALDEDSSTDEYYRSDSWTADQSSLYYEESQNNENYIREKELKQKVHSILVNQTNLDFNQNRRKPSRVDFNKYYFLLKTNLSGENFTNIELFNELSFYFSDNLFNMFKLLDNKWRMLIINELQDHIGKINSDKTVSHRNIPVGSEIEFKHYDIVEQIHISITGEVVEIIMEDSYRINSYENFYNVSICDITKILNNTKFKYNLNKLNNVDFL